MAACIGYDIEVTRAQLERRTVVEHGTGPAARDIRNLWEKVLLALA